MCYFKSNRKPLTSSAGACINADYRSATIAEDETRLPSLEAVPCDLRAFTCGDLLNRYRWFDNVIFIKELTSLLLIFAHHCSSRRSSAASLATAPRTKSWAVSGA